MVSSSNRWKDTHFKITVFMSSTRRGETVKATHIITASDRSSVSWLYSHTHTQKYDIYTDIYRHADAVNVVWTTAALPSWMGALFILLRQHPREGLRLVTIELCSLFTESTKWKRTTICRKYCSWKVNPSKFVLDLLNELYIFAYSKEVE